MTTAHISLGSNLGDREQNIRAAIENLRAVGDVTKTSSLYETEPVGFTAQPWFVNAVVELRTEKGAREMLQALLAIERFLGRDRGRDRAPTIAKGPRTIDLDIILFGEQIIDEAGLTIPHPAMHERRFVLQPLAEISPNAFHPVFMLPASTLLANLPVNTGVTRKLTSSAT